MSALEEIRKREVVARDAIRKAFGTPEDEDGATLFVLHHLEELDSSYWVKYLGTSTPKSEDVLNILEFKKLREDENEIEENDLEILDFTLPDNVTDYVISVQFNEDGEVDSIAMES